MTIKERIKVYANYRGYSISQVERMCKLSKGSFRNGKSMECEALANFLCCNPNLSAEWLMRGQGSMLITKTETTTTHQPQVQSNNVHDIIQSIGTQLINLSKIL